MVCCMWLLFGFDTCVPLVINFNEEWGCTLFLECRYVTVIAAVMFSGVEVVMMEHLAGVSRGRMQ